MSGKPLVTREQAKRLAVAHVAELDLKGWRYELVEATGPREDKWGAVFDTFSPEGNLVDGPVIFLVDAESGDVQPFDEWFERKRLSAGF